MGHHLWVTSELQVGLVMNGVLQKGCLRRRSVRWLCLASLWAGCLCWLALVPNCAPPTQVVCQPQTHKRCVGSRLYYWDSCMFRGGLINDCEDKGGCVETDAGHHYCQQDGRPEASTPDGPTRPEQSSGDGTPGSETAPKDQLPSCGNGSCESTLGENCSTCATDCKCPRRERCDKSRCRSYCGNGRCDSGERCDSCKSDCGCGSNEQCSGGSCVACECKPGERACDALRRHVMECQPNCQWDNFQQCGKDHGRENCDPAKDWCDKIP